MTITHLTIQNFGSLSYFDRTLTPRLNLIGSRCTMELGAAIAFLLCSKSAPSIPPHWLRPDTRMDATILLADTVYAVSAKPQGDQLQLSATDPTEADATSRYQYELSHWAEQDRLERFDGQDSTLPCCLYQYGQSPASHITGAKAFHRYLRRYIQDFRSEPINAQKPYRTALDSQGRFQVYHPEQTGAVHLSETERKLFLYICFLNIAGFWEGFERIRDLHHEKKPLLIQNFLEYLDASVRIDGLLERTLKLQRQILLLTTPMDAETKEKWNMI